MSLGVCKLCVGLGTMLSPFYGLGQTDGKLPVTDLQTPATSSPSFELASIRVHAPGYWPSFARESFISGRYTAMNIQIQHLIVLAYGLQNPKVDTQLLPGAPKWLLSDWYDIHAVVPEDEIASEAKLSEVQKAEYERRLLQQLLSDRFRLRLRMEQKPSTAYELVLAKDGPKGMIQVADYATELVSWPDWGHGQYHSAPLSVLVGLLTSLQGAPVIDKTGLTGRYDFNLEWARDPSTMPPAETSQEMESRPSISLALQQELGLKLVKIQMLIANPTIVHIERPSDN